MAKGRKTGGRVAGTPNKATREFRNTVATLLEENADNVSLWLSQVANGCGDIKPDPAKALDLVAKLAEFAAPKLGRTEVANAQDESFKTENKWVVEVVKSGGVPPATS